MLGMGYHSTSQVAWLVFMTPGRVGTYSLDLC